jgi:hypothetical protein
MLSKTVTPIVELELTVMNHGLGDLVDMTAIVDIEETYLK